MYNTNKLVQQTTGKSDFPSVVTLTSILLKQKYHSLTLCTESLLLKLFREVSCCGGTKVNTTTIFVLSLLSFSKTHIVFLRAGVKCFITVKFVKPQKKAANSVAELINFLQQLFSLLSVLFNM